jgi:hypothetical protein
MPIELGWGSLEVTILQTITSLFRGAQFRRIRVNEDAARTSS